jgi:hypothetical protein
LQPTPTTKPISIGKELVNAIVGAMTTGISALTGTLTVANFSDTKALSAAGVSAGVAALAFFGNSLRNWLNQN